MPVLTAYFPRPSRFSRTRTLVSAVFRSIRASLKDRLHGLQARSRVLDNSGSDAHATGAPRRFRAIADEDAARGKRVDESGRAGAHANQHEVGLARPEVKATPATQVVDELTRGDGLRDVPVQII